MYARNKIISSLILIYLFYCTIDRAENVLIKGDEPTVHQTSRRSLYTQFDAATGTSLNQGLNLLTITTTDNCDYSQTSHNELFKHARYGNEWPS